MTSAQLAPAIILPLIVWRIYARVRRTIGRQRLVVKRLKVRVGFLAVLTTLFAIAAGFYLPSLAAFLGALAVSVPLGWIGVRLTRFERTAEGDFYTPNTVIGLGLSLLLVGRFVYRFSVLYPLMTQHGVPQSPSSLHSPLTVGIVGLTFGYYVAYYAGVLIRARHLEPAAAR